MSVDRVDIEVVDKISTGPANKLLKLAQIAEQAYRNLEKVNGAIRANAQAEAYQAKMRAGGVKSAEQAGDAMVKQFQRITAERDKAADAQLKIQQKLTNALNAEFDRVDSASAKAVQRAATREANAAAARLKREGQVGDGMVALWAKNQQAQAKAADQLAKREKAALDRRMSQNKKFGGDYDAYFKKLTVTYTVNDVIASAASGANPLTILLQQAGQVTQAFGGLGGTLRALGGWLLTPIGAAVALGGALLGIGLALDGGRAKMGEYQRGLAQTNGATGLTISGFYSLSDAIASQANVTVSSSRDVAQAYAKDGRLQQEQIKQLSVATFGLSKMTGESADSIVKDFTRMIDGPTKYAAEFNAKYNSLTQAQFEHIKLLEDTGRKAEATRVLSQALYDYYGGTAAQKLGYIERGWNAVAKAVSNAMTAIQDFGRDQTTAEKLASLQRNFDASKDPRRKAAIMGAMQETQGQARVEGQAAERRAAAARSTQEAIKATEYFAAMNGRLADSQMKVNQEIAEYRNNLAKLKAVNPQSAEYKNALASQSAAEAKIRAQYMPKATAAAKAAENAAESREKVIGKIIASLTEELKLEGMLGEERAKQQKLNELENRAFGVGGLGKDRAGIEAQVDAIARTSEEMANLRSTYESIVGPQRDFANTEQSLFVLLMKGNISREKYAEQMRALGEAQADYNDPLRQTMQGLADERKALEATATERQSVIALLQIEAQLRQSGKTLDPNRAAEIAGAIKYNAALSRLRSLEEQYASTGIPALEEILIKQTALNNARDSGAISAYQYSVALTQLQLAEQNQNLAMGTGGFGDTMTAGLNSLVEGYRGALTELSSTFGTFFQGVSQGFADSIGQAIVMGDSLRDSLGNVARQGLAQLISGLIQVGIQQLIVGTIGLGAMTASTAASVAAAGVTAAAWATPAALVSAASFGAAPAAGSIALAAAVTAAEAMAMASMFAGYKSGGYTGNGGTSAPAGIVHGKEFVVNAQGTRRNRAALEAMNRGGTVGGGGGRSGMRVVVRQYPGVEIEERQLTQTDVEITARRIVRQEAPSVVSSQMQRRNSTVSRTMADNYRTTRRV